MGDFDTTEETATEAPAATTADRLEAKRAEQSELRLMADMYEAGFESVEDYRAWEELEELRQITKRLRDTGQKVTVGFDVGVPCQNVSLAGPPLPRKRHMHDLFPLAG